MIRRKSILIFFGVLLLAFVVWYFFLKRWDYKIYFTVHAHPSLVYSMLRNQHEWNGKTLKEGQITFEVKEPWKYLQDRLDLNDTTYLFDWYLTRKNDSVTKVSVGVSDSVRNLANRLDILFKKTPFEKSIKKNVIIQRNKIIERAKEFKFSFKGPDSVKEVPCIYISTKSSVRGKADEMIRNVITLNMFVKDNKLGLNGNPMVVVKNWNPESDSISFDFCFPILHPELIPDHPEIGVRTVSMQHAIEGDFYGNYSYSDYSWNLLFEEAQKESLQTTGRIIEVFYNDPHSGGNDLNWKAGIYLEVEK